MGGGRSHGCQKGKHINKKEAKITHHLVRWGTAEGGKQGIEKTDGPVKKKKRKKNQSSCGEKKQKKQKSGKNHRRKKVNKGPTSSPKKSPPDPF